MISIYKLVTIIQFNSMLQRNFLRTITSKFSQLENKVHFNSISNLMISDIHKVDIHNHLNDNYQMFVRLFVIKIEKKITSILKRRKK